MKKTVQLFLAVFIFTIFSSSSLKAQDDCCGMGSIFSSLLQSGIFGGYGVQQYGAAGWNEIVQNTLGLAENFKDFGFAHGWLIGANIIQLRHNDLILGFKLYYQSNTENQSSAGTYNGEDANQELDLKINNWQLGGSISYILNNNFDFRILDVYMTFPSVKLKNEIRTSSTSVLNEYESTGTNIGFTFDTGFVFYPAPPYVSIEIVGGYSFFSIEKMKLKNGGALNSIEDFIDKGGFFANAVLTVGIPFN
ncbi:MAG: hypothetical protein KJO59_08730 [Ignavibacteria bacterium]|nr:hypothetical protein [Ignavibacteria bacterium]